jgi:hypothetical protein
MTVWLFRVWGAVAIAACAASAARDLPWWVTLSWAVQVYVMGGLFVQRRQLNHSSARRAQG